MDSALSAKLASIVLLISICMLGHSVMMAQADVRPVPGQVVISSDVLIRQGDQVEYTFLVDTVVERLEITSSYMEIDNTVRIGISVSGAGTVRASLQFWDTDTASGRVILWNASSEDDVTALFTISSPDFHPDEEYQLKIDGVTASRFQMDTARTLSLSWGVWSDHLFELLIPDAADAADDPAPTEQSPKTSDPAETTFSYTSIGLIAFVCATTVILLLLLVRRTKRPGGSSRE